MLVLLGVGFLAGVITAVSPCVLPVLPILLAGGSSGRRPFRIIAGLVGSFVVFTLFATRILGALGLPDDLLRKIAIVMLFVLAVTLIVPWFGTLLEKPFARLTTLRAGGGGFLLGASLGLVFVPCAGPALAAIVTAGATNHVGLRAVLLTFAYAIGAAVPMVLIALGGQGLAQRLRSNAPRVRVVSGVVIGLVALAIAFNEDTRFQTMLPGYTNALQRHVEETHSASKALAKVNGGKGSIVESQAAKAAAAKASAKAADGVNLPVLVKSAPPLIAGGRWFNTKPLTLTSLHGKVVLVDFWTYSCINCLRTLPHLKSWYAAYHRDGLDIIGVHTPEFAFEHVPSNVQAAIERLGITYPVVQDNNYATWQNYQNQGWPADYLIDQQGRIRAYSFGEGDYSTMEGNIKALLGVDANAASVPDLTPTMPTTPESYLGFERLDPSRYVGSKVQDARTADYRTVANVPLDALAYSGEWDVQSQNAVAGLNARLTLHFDAHDVYLVLGGHGKVTVSVAGEKPKTIAVRAYNLYTLRSSKKLIDGVMHLAFTPGVEAYAFTFG